MVGRRKFHRVDRFSTDLVNFLRGLHVNFFLQLVQLIRIKTISLQFSVEEDNCRNEGTISTPSDFSSVDQSFLICCFEKNYPRVKEKEISLSPNKFRRNGSLRCN